MLRCTYSETISVCLSLSFIYIYTQFYKYIHTYIHYYCLLYNKITGDGAGTMDTKNDARKFKPNKF